MDARSETILASAIEFLIEGGEHDAASILEICEIYVFESGDNWYVDDEVHDALHVEISAVGWVSGAARGIDPAGWVALR